MVGLLSVLLLFVVPKFADMYKEINAPVGPLGLKTLQISTTALASNAANDGTYTQLEQQLMSTTTIRNMLASKMIATLEAAEFGGSANDAQSLDLANQGDALLK